MASITTLVSSIRNAIFGKDVRESIASAIEQVNADKEAYKTLADDAATAVKRADEIIAGKVGINDSSIGLGTTYSSRKITDDLNENLANLFMGGTQIFRNSNVGMDYATAGLWSNGIWFKFGTSYATVEKIAVSDAPNPDISYGMKANKIATGGDSGIRQSNIPLIIGEEYTMSCYARSENGAIFKMQVGQTGDAWAISEFTLSPEWVRYTVTFKALYPATSFIFGLHSARLGTAEICGMKLEVGNKATDWSPSPWDAPTGDSGWIEAELASSFTTYQNNFGYAPVYRKIGNMVTIDGFVSTTDSDNAVGTTANTSVFVLPSGYRPKTNVYTVAQCSGQFVCTMIVNVNGNVYLSSFRLGGTLQKPATSYYMCLHSTFMIS